MILLDTHVWIWWVDGSAQLPSDYMAYLQQHEQQGLGVAAISCWEVSKLSQLGRLQWTCDLRTWMAQALAYPGVRLLDLSPQIAVESTQLPGTFHRDPADQIIVATARIHQCALVTLDSRIRNYPHVTTAP